MATAGRSVEEDRPPTIMAAVLPAGAEAPTLEEALATLRGVERDEVGFEVVEARAGEAPEESGPVAWAMDVVFRARRAGEPLGATVWLERTRSGMIDRVADFGYDPAPMRGSEHTIGAALRLADRPLDQYHGLTKLLYLLAPETVGVIEPSSYAVRTPEWLAEVASAATPPSPMMLFNVHDVGDSREGGPPHWLHTHGLERCGIIELDVLEVPPEGTGLIGQLVNSVAGMFMDHGIPAPGTPFEAGMGIELLWLPWDEAMAHVPAGAGGGPGDRDEDHRGARGILFRPRRRWLFWRRYESPATYLPLLSENPVLYVSTMETERMSQLAAERLPRFLELLERFRGKERWVFLVKLGYKVDDAEEPNQREHLWFEVHARTGPREVDATLVNEPYGIAGMHEGDRGRHSLDRLTEWTILCEQGRFDADTVGRLEGLVGGGAPG